MVIYYREGGLGILDPGFKKKLQPPPSDQPTGNGVSDFPTFCKGVEALFQKVMNIGGSGVLHQRKIFKLSCKAAFRVEKKLQPLLFFQKKITTPTLISQTPPTRK